MYYLLMSILVQKMLISDYYIIHHMDITFSELDYLRVSFHFCSVTSSYESILKGNVCTIIVVMLSLKTLYTHRDINTQSSIKLRGHGQYNIM